MGVLQSFRKTQKTVLIAAIAIIAIVAPLVVNTLLNTTANPVKADSFFKFDEGYGTTSAVNDSNGAVSAGSITGATWKTDDLCFDGKCLYFDGNQDFVKFADDDDLDFTDTDNFTITFWFRHAPITSGTQVMIAKYKSTGTAKGYKIYMESDGDITLGVDDDSTWSPDDFATSTAATYDDNKWHHVAAVKTGTTSMILYIDGIKVAEDLSISAGTLANSDPFYIGIDGDEASNDYNGFVDEVKVYRSAKTESEIKGDYVKGSTLGETSASFGINDQSTLSDGLVGYWKMDETATPSADFSGNGNNGTWYNGVASTSGKFGNAVNLDGTDDYINAGSASSLDDIGNGTNGNGLTVSAWVNNDGAGTYHPQMIVSKESSGTPSNGWHFYYDRDENYLALEADFSGANLVKFSTDDSTTNAQWNFVTFTWDGSGSANNVHMYVNGIETYYSTSTDGTDGRVSDASQNLWIGDDSNGYAFDGKIDEVRIYNRALSPGEVQQLYNWAPGPVGWWKMDENQGNYAYDSSGNGNTGNLTGSMTQSDWVPGKFGSALNLDGIDDHIHIPDNTVTNVYGQQITMSAWVYLHSVTGRNSFIVKKTYDSGGGYVGGYMIYLEAAGYITSYIYNGTTFISCGTDSGIVANKWLYVTATYSSVEGSKFYIDGILKKTKAANGEIASSSGSDLIFGQIGWDASNNYYLDGVIDDVRIYKYIRTPSQIIEDMNAGHPAPGSPVGSAVGKWKFDEGYGDIAHDSSTNMNNGNLAGSSASCPTGADDACPTWTNSGKFSKALTFSKTGVDDYLEIPDSTSLRPGNESWTMSLWAKLPDANNQGALISKDDTGAGIEEWGMWICGDINCGTGGQYLWAYFNQNNTSTYRTSLSTTDVADNAWHHYVAVADKTQDSILLYMDGKRLATSVSNAGSWPTVDNTNPLRIGGANYVGSNVNADIDEVQVFNSALTDDQVRLLYNQGQAAVMGSVSTASSSATMYSSARSYCPPGDTGTCNPPVADWNFNENTGTTAYDSSGNNINHTLYNIKWVPGKTSSSIITTNNNSVREYAQTADNDLLDFSLTQSYTLGAWVKLGSSENNYFRVIMKVGDSPSRGYYMYMYDDKIPKCNYRYDTVYDTAVSSSAIDTNWHYITCVMDRSGSVMGTAGIYIFVDGILTGSDTTFNVTSDASNTSGLMLGENADTFEHDITLDDVKVYRYARTPAQIAWDYNQGGPLAWYKFDEGSGDTANNSSEVGSSVNGDLAGSGGSCPGASSCPTWTTGKLNSGLSFDNSNDYVAVPALTNFSSLTDFSVSAWYNSNGTNNTILQVHDGSATATADELRLRRDSTNTIEIKTNNAIRTNTITATTNGTWHHIIVTRSGTTLKAYLDGKLESSVADSSGALDLSHCNLLIGTDNDTANCSSITPTNVFDGTIDDVKIWNYALTAEQILTEYNQGVLHFGP